MDFEQVSNWQIEINIKNWQNTKRTRLKNWENREKIVLVWEINVYCEWVSEYVCVS